MNRGRWEVVSLVPKYLDDPDYDPESLLDELKAELGARHDTDLAMLLKVDDSHISQIRHRKTPVSAAMMIRMCDVAGLTINDVREMMNVEVRL